MSKSTFETFSKQFLVFGAMLKGKDLNGKFSEFVHNKSEIPHDNELMEHYKKMERSWELFRKDADLFKFFLFFTNLSNLTSYLSFILGIILFIVFVISQIQ